MKQRITAKHISDLNENQKQALNDLWIPSVYDVVVAMVCTDVEEEKYENIEFVIGGIQLYNRTGMILHDIRYIESQNPNESNEEVVDEGVEAEVMEDIEDETEEDNTDFYYSRPTAFNKEDCLPLLTIGQMIELLEKKSFGYGDFYLAAGKW